jgi:RNA polymerase sigma-70 factor (ECF subfamily)
MDAAAPPPKDSALVARTLAGDREAFGQLYDRYARLVRAVVHDATADPTTVHDLTQEVFLRAFRQLARLREPERVGPWLVGIARLVSREQRRRRPWEPLGDGEPAGEPLAAVDEADEAAYLLRLVGQLPEPERLAVHCFFLSERGVAETGRLLKLSRSGTYAVLQRACARLARWLGCERGAAR